MTEQKKGLAGRVYSLTPKGEAAISVFKKSLEELEREFAKIDSSKTTKGES